MSVIHTHTLWFLREKEKEKKSKEKSREPKAPYIYHGPVEVLRFQIFSSKLQLK